MKCETCNKEHDGSYTTGRFCNRSCANGFARSKLSDEHKKLASLKASAKMTKYKLSDLEKICPVCQKLFVAKPIRTQTCSRSCAAKFRFIVKTEDAKLKFAQQARIRLQERYLNGDISIGWQSRTKEPSYPEKFFAKALADRGIHFEREVKIGKWFADFVIDKKILEIDGRQHEDRKEKDAEKDAYLISKGYSVFRIKWKNPKTELGVNSMMIELHKALF